MRDLQKEREAAEIRRHHALENSLMHLRSKRDGGYWTLGIEEEEAILDDMADIWYELSDEGRKILEEERKAGVI